MKEPCLDILVIEDNELNRYLLTFLLEHRGHRVRSATDGPAGIALAKALLPDLILLDIQLPTMHGYDVAASLREVESVGNIPIIAVTSHAMAGDREKALAAGCSGYIEKPIDPDTFVDEVESVCWQSPDMESS
ncbi:MAG: two-component system cell cycle response regulator DivK [Porticoccus sp.]|jgi:two-component system cell cycle response regulator DivK|uniref:response regulator n=1 Tax=Porticoccus sp. TaxID=2024853 RepID=UPI0039E68F2B|tara:strand:+ start:245 stop:643 length:399 start_codon:yes stop_codon:yes gene_type:complete